MLHRGSWNSRRLAALASEGPSLAPTRSRKRTQYRRATRSGPVSCGPIPPAAMSSVMWSRMSMTDVTHCSGTSLVYEENKTRRTSTKAMNAAATVTSAVGGVHETPKIGVLTPLTRDKTSANRMGRSSHCDPCPRPGFDGGLVASDSHRNAGGDDRSHHLNEDLTPDPCDVVTERAQPGRFRAALDGVLDLLVQGGDEPVHGGFGSGPLTRGAQAVRGDAQQVAVRPVVGAAVADLQVIPPEMQ